MILRVNIYISESPSIIGKSTHIYWVMFSYVKSVWRFPSMGRAYPNGCMIYNGKSENQIDDLWGYLHFGKLSNYKLYLII